MRERKKLYETVALGGTFDVFHKGHEQLLSTAFQISHRVIIGITSDQFAKTLGKTHPIEPYRTRVRNLRSYLAKHRWSKRAEVHPLNDSFGPAAKRRNLQAIVVTPDTLSSGRKLNRLRQARSLFKLSIHTATFAFAKDGKRISSTRIRKGEIDRRGQTLRPSVPERCEKGVFWSENSRTGSRSRRL